MQRALTLEVVKSYPLNSLFQRVILTGSGLDDLCDHCQGLHIKLFFKRDDQTPLILPQQINGQIVYPQGDLNPIVRTYSIREFKREQQQLTVDFLLHKKPGVAGEWAKKAKAGDCIGFAGPGPMPLFSKVANRYLLIGDASSMPAYMAIIDQIDKEALIDVVIEIPKNHAPFVEILREGNIKWHWLTQKFTSRNHVLALIRTLGFDVSNTSVTLSGEHQRVLDLRQYFRSMNINKNFLYAVPYWRHQQSEEHYHALRHKVMEQ